MRWRGGGLVWDSWMEWGERKRWEKGEEEMVGFKGREEVKER